MFETMLSPEAMARICARGGVLAAPFHCGRHHCIATTFGGQHPRCPNPSLSARGPRAQYPATAQSAYGRSGKGAITRRPLTIGRSARKSSSRVTMAHPCSRAWTASNTSFWRLALVPDVLVRARIEPARRHAAVDGATIRARRANGASSASSRIRRAFSFRAPAVSSAATTPESTVDGSAQLRKAFRRSSADG